MNWFYKIQKEFVSKSLISETPKEQIPTVIITVGIPCSGKSTWVEKNKNNFFVISRDQIRANMFGKKYKQNKQSENLVTRRFNNMLSYRMELQENIILDNTHCKEAYLKAAIQMFHNTKYVVIVKFFDISLHKAYVRNIRRWFKTRKWIPFKVIKNMYLDRKSVV